MLFIGIMVPNGLQRSVLSPSDKGVWTVLCGVLKGHKLFLSHISGIETSSKRPVIETFHERLAIHTVPRAVINLSECLLERIGEAPEQSILVSEILIPINSVNLISGETVEVQDLFTIVGDSIKIGCGNCHKGVVRHLP